MFKKISLTLAITITFAASAGSTRADSCSFSPQPFMTRYGCTMLPNQENHFLHVFATPYIDVNLIDIWNGVTVFSQSGGFFWMERTITGLYSAYITSGVEYSFPDGLGWITVSN